MNDIPDMVPKVAVDTIKANFRDEIAALRTEFQEAREALREIAEDRVPPTYGGGVHALRKRAETALTPPEPAEDKE